MQGLTILSEQKGLLSWVLSFAWVEVKWGGTLNEGVKWHADHDRAPQYAMAYSLIAGLFGMQTISFVAWLSSPQHNQVTKPESCHIPLWT